MSGASGQSLDAVGLRDGAAQQAAVDRARAALGFEREDDVVVTRLTLALEVDQHGAECSLTHRATWRALRDGVDALPSITVVPAPASRRPVIEPQSGCRVGPDYADLGEGVFATALRLERRLAGGETVVTEHRAHLPDDPRRLLRHEHRLLHRVEQVDVSVRFHPDLRPGECAFSTRTGDVETWTALTSHDGVWSGSAGAFGPGAVGFRWQW